MHGLNRINVKLKTLWTELTRHRTMRAVTKKRSMTRLRPRKTKASPAPVCQDDTKPPDSKSLEVKPPEEDEEMLDHFQTPDEDLRDYDEESEEDEGSLYVPSEATSDLDMEIVDKEEESLKLLRVPPCMFLLRLPREIRDKIYENVLRLDTPMSDHRLRFKCMSCPSLTGTANKPTWQSQISGVRNILRTCKQIRAEGTQAFYKVNSWSLHRARLRENPVRFSALLHDTQKVYDRLRQIEAMKLFKHVNMRISLSPLAYCDLTVPDSVALDDPVAVHLFELSLHPGVVAFHKLDENAQCELFRAAIQGLLQARTHVFPKLRSLTLEVSLHTKMIIPNVPRDPLDRCGITFYIRVFFRREYRTRSMCHEGSVIHDLSILPRVSLDVHNHSLQPMFLGGVWNKPHLDPRRHMLSPLSQFHGVQYVEVERRWTVIYRKRSVEDGKEVIREQPLRQLWRFLTVSEMLERAGPGFVGFLDPALEFLETSSQDVVNIIENTWNTIDDVGHLLIP